MKRKIKYEIFLLILLLALGFAAVSTTLMVNGTGVFVTNEEDFKVVFTKSIIDGVDVTESTISEDGRTLTFTTSELAIINDISKLEFTVTNNSTQYDAKVSMECVAEGKHANTYYKVESELPEVISAASKENGIVAVTLLKTSVESIEETFTCRISAVAQERDTIGKMKLNWLYTDLDADGKISEGDLYVLGNERFNVISQTENTVTMLAQYNLGINYKQSSDANQVSFAEIKNWEYAPGPKEIDIQQYEGNAKKYVNEYVTYLKNETNSESISGNLITMTELKSLGCTISDDYTFISGLTCVNSSNERWLVNGQHWWTRSAYAVDGNYVWDVYADGTLCGRYGESGIRPVITISKSAL